MRTIEEVAKEAGVSVATVSRVINRNANVSPEATERVNAAIAKFHYQPNEWGRSLRRKESRTILVFIPNITNPYYSSIVTGIEDMARRNKYTVMLCITNNDKVKEKEYTDLLSNGRADGAIFLATVKDDTNLSKLAKNFPVVQCCEYCNEENILHVSIDNFKSAYQVVKYMISLNHRKIGFIGSTNQYISTDLRQKGYLAALKDAGIPEENQYISSADSDYSFLSGMRAANEILCLQDRPTAIFCISDVIALGAIRAAQEMNLRVPEDVTIIGFDDVEYATMFKPMLTTVSQPGYSIGKVSADLLLKKIAGEEKGGNIFLEHKLILRESSAANQLENR